MPRSALSGLASALLAVVAAVHPVWIGTSAVRAEPDGTEADSDAHGGVLAPIGRELVEVGDEAKGEQAPPDDSPAPPVTVPPPAEPAPPTPEQQQLAEALSARLDRARLGLMVAVGLEAQAATAAALADADVDARRAEMEAIGDRERSATVALEHQRARVQRWAVQAYAGGSLRRVAYVLDAKTVNDVSRRLGLAAGAIGALEEDVDEREAALGAVVAQHRTLAAALAAAEGRRAAARLAVAEVGVQVAHRRDEVVALDAGQVVSLGGVAFPVAAPNHFVDTFGAPRMAGTSYAHTHRGVDIFAAAGAPVVAFERGVVVGMGTDVLGGTKLWLAGHSGTRYYYAHLRAFAPALADGQVVEVGQTLAFVGNTGNASTTPPHLHFEIHPRGGPAVDPYPIVAGIAEAARTGAMALGAPAGGRSAATVGPAG